MLGGLDNPTSGEVIIDGRNISGLSRDELTVYRRRKIGFNFKTIISPLMNVYENIVLYQAGRYKNQMMIMLKKFLNY